jgi:hypothetical protein
MATLSEKFRLIPIFTAVKRVVLLVRTVSDKFYVVILRTFSEKSHSLHAYAIISGCFRYNAETFSIFSVIIDNYMELKRILC